MSAKVKNALWIIFAAVMILVFVVLLIKEPGPEHVEDTNGADNFELQSITEQDIIGLKIGSRGSVSQRERQVTVAGWQVSDGVTYSSKKFTGVYMLYSTTLIKGSDIYVSLAEYEITSGNFAFYIVFDGEIVGKILPSDDALSEFYLENVDKSGTLEYVIAGESASFKFISPLGW